MRVITALEFLKVIDYSREENRVLREQLGERLGERLSVSPMPSDGG